MSALDDLQKWFDSNCDGEWEEDFGIKIETTSNPGWLVTIDLEETNLKEKPFHQFRESASETDWIECRVNGLQFQGNGDAGKLERILQTFIDWAKSQNGDWLKPPDPMTPEQRQKHEDEMLFTSLGNEVEGEKCRHEGCSRDRIRNSIMCREHHFEMVTGRPVPPRAS